MSSEKHFSLPERQLPAAGHTRRTLEDRFHIMIVILIEPTQLLWGSSLISSKPDSVRETFLN